MAKERRSYFAGRVSEDIQRQNLEGTNYGHLILPKGVDIWNPKPGATDVMIDILPYVVTDPHHLDFNPRTKLAEVGSLWYKKPYYVHNNVGGQGQKAICMRTWKKACPICEYRNQRFKEGAPKTELQEYNSSQRILYAIVPLNDKEAEATVHIWDIAYYNFQQLLNKEIGARPKYEIFPDPEEGYTLIIRFEAASISGGKPFAQADRIDFEERPEIYDDEFLKTVPDLDKMIPIETYNSLKAKFTQDTDENYEEEGLHDVDDREASRVSYRTRRDDVETEQIEHTRSERTTRRETPRRTERAERTSEREKPGRRSERATRQKEESDVNEESKSKSPRERRLPSRREQVEEESNDKPVHNTRASSREKEEPEDECPFGHEFGTDWDAFKDCLDCELFDNCGDAYKAINN